MVGTSAIFWYSELDDCSSGMGASGMGSSSISSAWSDCFLPFPRSFFLFLDLVLDFFFSFFFLRLDLPFDFEFSSKVGSGCCGEFCSAYF